MSLATEGGSQKTLSFSPRPPQEHIQRFPVTREAAGPRVGADSPTSRRQIAGATARQVRRHWILLVLLAAGLGLRVVTQLAYRPALLYIDSAKYLTTGLEKYDPQGYRVFLLRPLLWVGNLAVVAGFQHLLGLAMALAVYATLLRRHTPRWAAPSPPPPSSWTPTSSRWNEPSCPTSPSKPSSSPGSPSSCGNPGRRLTPWRWAGSYSACRPPCGSRRRARPALAVCLLAARGWRTRLSAASLLTASFAIPVLVYMTYSAVILPTASSCRIGRRGHVRARGGGRRLRGAPRPGGRTAAVPVPAGSQVFRRG